MEVIRYSIINKYPETKNLVLPSTIHLKSVILPNLKLSKYYNKIESSFFFPIKKLWLKLKK